MRRFMSVVPLLFVFSLAAGCAANVTKVPLLQSSYNPTLDAADLSGYKGKTVIFPYVTNNANDTGTWNYYSDDKKFSYEMMPGLDIYFWDCFVNAFSRIGVRAVAAPLPGFEKSKELQITLLSFTDRKLLYTVRLNKPGEASFTKQFTVEAPAPTTTVVAELENRAYRFMDSAFLALVTDAEFKKSFLQD